MSIFLLQETDVMRYPYEGALKPLAGRVLWHSSLESLLNSAAKETPGIVVIDLDCLKQPIENEIEMVRAHFPSSELIALSSSDTSQQALQCLRAGFSDFLLKPTSPEELAHAVRKSQQKHDLINRVTDPKSAMVRAITQISSSATPTLARLYAIEYLAAQFQAEGAAWLHIDEKSLQNSTVVSSIPKKVSSTQVLKDFPFSRLEANPRHPMSIKEKNGGQRRIIIPCQHFSNDAIFLWNAQKKGVGPLLKRATLLVEHTEVALQNLMKFEQVKQQTFIDDLTGLYNSRYLKYALNNAIMKCKRPDQRFSLLFIDVDHFKSINDKHSHLVGSEFLITIGKTIKNAVRKIDPVFRYGGDEFVVILNDTATDGAFEIAERIRKNIERRLFVIREVRLQTTVSIGLACYPDHASNSDSLLKLADEAMYSAKRQSRNSVHLASAAASKKSGESELTS